MLADSFMYYVQRFLPGQYWHWVIVGAAVVAALGGALLWMRKKKQAG